MLRTSTKQKSLLLLLENGCVARLCVINSVYFGWEALRPQPWLCLIIDSFRKIAFTEKRRWFIVSWCQCLNGYFDLICACHAPSKWLSRDKSNLTYWFNRKNNTTCDQGVIRENGGNPRGNKNGLGESFTQFRQAFPETSYSTGFPTTVV